LFFGPISGICSTINVTYEECKQNTIFTALAMASSFITTFFIAAIKFGNFENDCSKHSQFSARFASLEHNINRQLTLVRTERENPLEYFGFVGRAFDDLVEQSPHIPSNVSRHFLKKAKENKLAIPDVLMIDITKTSVSLTEHKPLKTDIKPEIPYDMNKFTDGALKYELDRFFQSALPPKTQ
jgi:hypothetical protein